MNSHNLKILPKYFVDIYEKMMYKTFELRKNDRNFKVGDLVILKEWTPEHGFTNRWVLCQIDYLIKNVEQYGLNTDYCIFSFLKLTEGIGIKKVFCKD